MVIFFSCTESRKKREQKNEINQLVKTSSGDTVETGYWQYSTSANGVSKSGNYSEGFKTNDWVYHAISDSTIKWSVFDENGIKFSIPNSLKRLNKIEPPIIFHADIQDGDNNTYLALLKYDLKKMKLSVYDYLHQYNNSLENNQNEHLISKEDKKFTFKSSVIFRVIAKTKQKTEYEAISFIFNVNDFLYDLSYKRRIDKSSPIDLEIFNDILYSVQIDRINLFSYDNKKFIKEEEIQFKD